VAKPTSGPVPASTPPDPAVDPLRAAFADLEKSIDARLGVVVVGVGAGKTTVTLGDWDSGPAWSTIKVPLAIAALRHDNSSEPTDAMIAAITQSDNDAAEKVWESLGDPVTAAGMVQDVLRQYGDPTTVQSQRVRPPFSAFGQTDWSLTHQATFLANAVCDGTNEPILTLMGQVEPAQQWGLGILSDTRIKGGWGPYPEGNYLVRQMGVISGATGKIVVAMAAQPASGSFADGTYDLNKTAKWLNEHIDALPSGNCG
jgi:hypothetical protein